MTFNQELITKARKGEIAILNDGSVEELREILKECWPDDDDLKIGTSKYYFKSRRGKLGWANAQDSIYPAHSVKDFFMDQPESKELDRVLPNLEFIIYAEETKQVAEDSWRRQRRTLKVDQDSTLREIWKWANEQNVDLNSLSIHKLETLEP